MFHCVFIASFCSINPQYLPFLSIFLHDFLVICQFEFVCIPNRMTTKAFYFNEKQTIRTFFLNKADYLFQKVLIVNAVAMSTNRHARLVSNVNRRVDKFWEPEK